MNEQEKTQASSNAVPANADVAINETNDSVVQETSGGALPIGLPPFGKIFYGFLAVLATALLWSGAGSLKKQACIDELIARYPTGAGMSAKAASLNTNTLKGHLKECASSPF